MARPRLGVTAAERFFAFVEKGSTDGDCWEWRGYRQPLGYGRFRVEGRKTLAHRYAYELLVGPIPDGLSLDHLCRNPPCVNPAHLEPVTHRENVLRGEGPAAHHATKTHCPSGHAYSSENTVVDNRNRRVCRTCKTNCQRTRRARRKQLQSAKDGGVGCPGTASS
ncbi:HNH endonuclease signature motif containing protein [Jatrophihabitans sp. GAS493]|uniref:HNH endonuclease signature motif containing protein n=1 Tax=Jatrophihabitans sp. GAS493 TaxID=1907575 RepID=UPI000BB69F6E